MSEDRKWEIYLKEKAKLMQQNLTCAEYEQKIKELCDRLGL